MFRKLLKKSKRLFQRMRVKRSFALGQLVIVILIVYLAKRSRDRHKRAVARRAFRDDVISPLDIDHGDSAALSMDTSQNLALLGSVQDKRNDVFADVPEDTLPVMPKAEPVFKSGGGQDTVPEAAPVVVGPPGVLPPPADNQQPPPPPGELPLPPEVLPPAPDTLGADQPPAPDSTFHFPVPGEEMPLGDLSQAAAAVAVPEAPAALLDALPPPVEAPSVPVYDDQGLEIIPRPDEMAQLNPETFSLEVTEEMINNFRVNLPPLLENFKNPCWIETVPEGFTYDDSFFNTCHYVLHTNKLKHGAQYKAFENILKNRTMYGDNTRIRCFPYFFLIGVGKSGTTDVFDTLKKYFYELAPIFLKEPHYWEWKRCIDKMICKGGQRTPTFAEYLDSFDSSSDFMSTKKKIMPDGSEYHDMIIGDFTPSTLAFHPCWKLMPDNKERDEPRYINAHYIRAIRPETKFIAIMRDPVERIFSNYRMSNRMAAEQVQSTAEDFHQEMVTIIDYLKTCMLTKTTRACAYSIMKFDFGTHVTNSMYEVFISDWFKIFPRDQFLFLRMEDYMESRVPNFRNIVNFLELEPMAPEREMMIGSKSVVNQAPPAAMFNETRAMLQDFFRPLNRRLADVLGDEGWLWGY